MSKMLNEETLLPKVKPILNSSTHHAAIHRLIK